MSCILTKKELCVKIVKKIRKFKTMKQISSILISICIVFTLSACTGKTETEMAVTVQPTAMQVQTTAVPEATATPAAEKVEYIGNKRSGKFHRPYCATLPKEENRVELPSREAAIDSGFVPCKRCNP